MKYIDAEKLKVVLASHYREITVPVITDQGGIESYFRRAEIHDILDIITSLQQEHQEVDLEKEYKEWWENKVSGNMNIQHTVEWYMHETARHFAVWGAIHLNARKEE